MTIFFVGAPLRFFGFMGQLLRHYKTMAKKDAQNIAIFLETALRAVSTRCSFCFSRARRRHASKKREWKRAFKQDRFGNFDTIFLK
jgi:hypothetical protein